MAVVVVWTSFEGRLEGVQSKVLGLVTDGVQPELPSGTVGLHHIAVELRDAASQPEVLGSLALATIGCCGLAIPVDKDLDGTDPQPVIAHPRPNPERQDGCHVAKGLVAGCRREAQPQPYGEAAFLSELMEGAHRVGRCRQGVNGGYPLLHPELGKRLADRFPQLVIAKRRDREDIEGLAKHPRGKPVGPAIDPAAWRIGEASVDTAGLQRPLVGDLAVHAPAQHHRMVRRDAIQLLFAGHLLAIGSLTQDPGSGWKLCRLRLYQLEYRGAVGNRRTVDTQQEMLGARRVLDVIVSVDEAGQQALAVELDDLCRRPDPGLDIRVGAHRGDTVADDRHRLMEASLRVHGDDVATTEDEVGARDGLLIRRTGAADKGQQEQRSSSAST